MEKPKPIQTRRYFEAERFGTLEIDHIELLVDPEYLPELL